MGGYKPLEERAVSSFVDWSKLAGRLVEGYIVRKSLSTRVSDFLNIAVFFKPRLLILRQR